MDLRYPIHTDLLTLQSYWVSLLRARLKQKCGLTLSQYRVLSCLDTYGDSSIRDISHLLELSSSTITYIVDKLEKRSLVSRMDSNEDRRITKASLMPEGKELHDQAYVNCREVTEIILAPLGDFLKNTMSMGLEAYQENYSFFSKSKSYLADDIHLNNLLFYESAIEKALSKFDLTGSEFRALFELDQHPRGMNASDLSLALLVKLNGLTSICDSLNDKGLIFRSQSIADRRSIILEISTEGYGVLRKTAPIIDSILVQGADGEDPEIHNMILKAAGVIIKQQRKYFFAKQTRFSQ